MNGLGESGEWLAPREFLAPLAESVGGFDLDPTAPGESPVAEESFADETEALDLPWFGDVWANPVRHETATWARKIARESFRADVDLIVALLPDDTSTEWYHEAVLGRAAFVCFVDHRLRFGDAEHSAATGSHVAIYGEAPTALLERLTLEGALVPVGSMLSFDDTEHSQAALSGFTGDSRE